MQQYKDFRTTIKDVDEKGRVLVAANAIGNVDADKDRSMDGSFDKTLKDNFSRLKWFLNHDKNLLLGVPIEGKQDGKYLEMLGQLNMKKQLGRDTYEDYRLYAEHGKSLEHSIGVEPVKFYKDKLDENIRNVTEWKLWEYSTLTSWGANENTPMLGIKSEKELADHIDWLELKIRKGNFSDEHFVKLENCLILLRSLCTEPSIDTQKAKPNDKEEGQKLILAINNFVKQLNSTNYERERAFSST